MYKLLLCVRYLRTKYIALACIISVMLGVATMIVVNSVMAGFTNEMRDRLHNFLADIVIESRSMDGIADADRHMATIQQVAGKYIAAMTPTIEVPGMVTFTDPYTGESYTSPVRIQGIDPEGKARVGPLQDYLDSYNAVIEDDAVVREPLRTRDETLGWELTADAAERRKLRKEQELLFLDEARSDSVAAPGTDVSGDNGATDGNAAPTMIEFDQPEMVPPTESMTSDVAATAPQDDSAIDDALMLPNGLQVPDLLDQAHEQADRARPMAARVYLGEGIVSFQAVDPRTGSRRKVMMVESGDDVVLSTVAAGRSTDIIKFSATVVDSFRSGMNEYDETVVLMNLKELQKNRGMHINNAVTGIHIRLHDYKDAPAAINALNRAFPPGLVTVRTWEEKQGLLLSAVEVETAILNVLLFLIIMVAGFGILAIFYMIVVEKTRDIGILKSLGASSNGVMSIFLSYGLALGIVGSTAGVIIGLLFVNYINEIEDALSWITGRKVFDEKIYYFFEIPTSISPVMVALVALGAISIAVLASILPARRAARLHPVRALRFE